MSCPDDTRSFNFAWCYLAPVAPSFILAPPCHLVVTRVTALIPSECATQAVKGVGNSPFGEGGDLNHPHFLHPLKSLAGFHKEHTPDIFVPACHPAVLFKGARWGDAWAESKGAAVMWAVGRPSKDARAEAALVHCAPFRLRASLLFMSSTFQSSQAVVDRTLCFVLLFYPLASTHKLRQNTWTFCL